MSPILSSEQIEAFHTIDLRLTFISHGHGRPWPNFIALENGPAVTGVSDNDYATVDAAMNGMVSGDVVARERYFGAGLDPDAPPSNGEIISRVCRTLIQSPYVK